MGKLEQAKLIYDEIEIPKELEQMVNDTIEKSKIMHNHNQKKEVNKRKGGRHFVSRWAAGSAAAAAAVLMIGLNTSSTFAAAAQDVPVLGNLARVLTFRTYETAEEDMAVYGEVPGVELIGATVEEKAFSDEVNARIQEQCDAYLKGAVERVEEYRTAFLETGGTEEEFAEKNIVISVDYEVKSQTEDTLSFVVNGTESWVSAYAMSEYYNLDLRSLKYLTLNDVLGESYVDIANESIKAQMREREEADENMIFWTEEEGGFASVDENTRFYINTDGLPVIVFEKYEVGPGAMGSVEFVINPSGAEAS